LILSSSFVQFPFFQIETLSENKAYMPLLKLSEELGSDETLPPFWRLEDGSRAKVVVHLDKERPLSEPKWIKTGDIQDWLKDMFGGRFWVAGDAVGWEKKIEVRYPDPVRRSLLHLLPFSNLSPRLPPSNRCCRVGLAILLSGP
jgi:20S proteasome subunit alpha 6